MKLYSVLVDVFFIVGAALVAYGGYLVYHPAGAIVAGLFFLYLSGFPFMGDRRRK